MPKTANAKKIDKKLSKKPLPVKQEKPPKNVKVKHAPPISSKDIIAKAEANAPKPLKSGPAPNAVAKKAVLDSSSSDDSSSSESESEPQPSKAVPQQTKTNGKSVSSKKPTPTHITANAKNQKKQEASSSDSSSDSDSSDDDSSSRDEPKEPASLIKANGTSKSTKPDSGSEDESSDDSTTGTKSPVTQKATANDNCSDSEDSTSEDEKPKSQQIKSLPQPSAESTEESSSSSEDSESGSDSDLSASPKTPAFASKKPQSAKDSSSDTDASSGEGSSDSGSDEDVEMEIRNPAAVVTGKRKAEDGPALAVKKPKIDGSITGAKPDDNSTKTIFVGNLSWTVDNDRLSQEFADCGEVISARVQLDRNTGKSRGFGFVTFATTEAVEAAVTLNGTKEIDGRILNLDKTTENGASREKRAQAFGDARSAPSKVLFVGNLSWNTVEDTVWDAFSEYGEVASVRIPTDKESGRPKGYGYVEFGAVDSAQKAIDAMNGKELDGRSIRLDFTQPRDANSGGPGRGAGFAGGRGRGGFDGGRGRGGFDGGRGRGGFDRGRGRGGSRGRGGDRGRGRGGARGGTRFGAIAASEGQKITF